LYTHRGELGSEAGALAFGLASGVTVPLPDGEGLREVPGGRSLGSAMDWTRAPSSRLYSST
jgi:hypothetical protein